VVVCLGFDVVFSLLAKRLAGKSNSKMTCFVTSGLLHLGQSVMWNPFLDVFLISVNSGMCWYHVCSVFGELKSLRVPKKVSGTGTHRGFGFADFLTKEDAKVSCLSFLSVN